MRPVLFAALGAATLFAVVGTSLGYKSRTDVSYRGLRVVEPGVLYRSGQLETPAFQRVVREYDIHTVITFRDSRPDKDSGPLDTAEEAYCKAAGIAHYRLPPRKWGSPDGGPPPVEENVREFLRLIRERRPAGPILIHCFAGTHRTGAYTALYRMEFDGWSNAEAIAEMQEHGYTTLGDDRDILRYLQTYTPRRVGSRPGG